MRVAISRLTSSQRRTVQLARTLSTDVDSHPRQAATGALPRTLDGGHRVDPVVSRAANSHTTNRHLAMDINTARIDTEVVWSSYLA
jgi:hypothetical protein